jgi:hypothetical protein
VAALAEPAHPIATANPAVNKTAALVFIVRSSKKGSKKTAKFAALVLFVRSSKKVTRLK